MSFFCLTYFTKHNTLQVHSCCGKWQNFILFYSVTLYIHIIASSFIHLLMDS